MIIVKKYAILSLDEGGVPMYYGLIILSVVMFGGCFALNDVYRKMRGSSFKISLENSFVGGIAGIIVLIAINGADLQLTPFTFIMAALAAINGIAFTVCSFKALDYINLSVFSLFSMLGGMVLPFLQGIFFYGEGMTLAKAACLAFIIVALLLTVSWGKSNGGTLFYIGIFVLNGTSGVLSKIFASAPFEKASAASYSIWHGIISVVIAGVLWFILYRHQKSEQKNSARALAISALTGSVNKIANFILVLALSHVAASVQYPMVTGGTMIVCTLISFLGDKKPTKKEVASVILAFAGMLALFAIPV